ncbi:hypothetical protein Poli38472_006394 [Pythium oligandrum]|uniref:Purple acid phosphatase n=1 Tax=Pythium oligandrum TaxID=41045 RepID=A0A8K1FD08_PYTOL|nr:hypothetical protein Poli38472_006394 [Pythium oligandrum]|eukprot:TMW56384.1 hypothetical protein Poli38472_006394 [Pythium oligandrum]
MKWTLAGLFAVALSASVLFNSHADVPALSGSTSLRREAGLLEQALPTQVHVSLYDKTWSPAEKNVGIAVSWATGTPTQRSMVRFGRSATELPKMVEATSPCEQYEFCDYTSPWFHHVVIPGDLLEPNTTYYYRCGDPTGGWSELLTFTTSVAVGSQAPVTFAVIGDLGQTEYSEQTLRHLINQDGLTAILHAGDLSYADNYQPRWDRWGKLVEPLASTCPWMVSVGNHEEERPCQDGADRFVAYQKRFRMPYDVDDGKQAKNQYYGFRVGMVHFIVVHPYTATDANSPQYQWLSEELGRVDRTLTPWVVVIMHGPWYNSNTAHQGREPHLRMKDDMEDLLFEHKVDLVFSGHVHAYERSFPVYKEVVRADGIVYVVLGDGGNREGLAPTYIHPKPAWSAFRQANYGFGLFHVLNHTHASIEMYEDREAGSARLHDQAWLTSTQFRATQALTAVTRT